MARKNRCSVCGQLGHNKRSCKALKKNGSNEPTPVFVQTKRYRRPPTCSRCGVTGHTARKCHGELYDYRAMHSKKLQTPENAIKVGDLIRDSYQVGIVTKIFFREFGSKLLRYRMLILEDWRVFDPYYTQERPTSLQNILEYLGTEDESTAKYFCGEKVTDFNKLDESRKSYVNRAISRHERRLAAQKKKEK